MKKQVAEKSILMVPLMMAFIWMGFLVLNNASLEDSTAPGQLSPTRLDGLVNALFAFIIIYAIVLFVVFYRMNKALKSLDGLKISPKKKKRKK